MFAREGAKVAIGDILDAEGKKVEAEINESGGECLFVHLDVTSEEDWQRAVESTVGRFGKLDFIYKAENDEYECPAGERLKWRFETVESGQTLHKYWSSACPRCPIRSRCTTGQYRRIARWEHEAVVDALQARLDREPERMRARRETVEHPFGTIKSWMGSTHFQMKTLERVSTEMSLHVLAYNMKRVMRIMGVGPLMEAIRA